MNTIKVIIVIFLFNMFAVASVKSTTWVSYPLDNIDWAKYGYTVPNNWAVTISNISVLDSTSAMMVLRVDLYTEVRHSTDGGKTWNKIYDDYEGFVTNRLPLRIQHPAPNHFFFLSRRLLPGPAACRIIRSRDGGVTVDTIIVINEAISNNNDVSPFSFTMYDTMVGALCMVFSIADRT